MFVSRFAVPAPGNGGSSQAEDREGAANQIKVSF